MAASDGHILASPATGAVGQPVTAGTDFNCHGGIYVLSVCSSAFNAATVTLQMLGPDGATWIPCGTATTLTANGNGVAYLPPCRVRVAVTGGTPTALYASLARVNG